MPLQAQGMPRKTGLSVCCTGFTWKRKNLVLETGMHPGELKDMVCSPAGSTIEGVRILEQKGFRSAVFEALNGAAEKKVKRCNLSNSKALKIPLKP